MQVLVQKVGDVARIQQVQQSEHNNRQQQFAQQIEQQTEKNSQTVNQPLRNESKLVHEKQEREKKSKKNKKKAGEQDIIENNEPNIAIEKYTGTTIDIKI